MGPQLKTALYHPRGRKKKLKLAFPVGSELKLQKGVSYLLSITMEAGKLAFLVGSKQNSREGIVQGKKKKKKKFTFQPIFGPSGILWRGRFLGLSQLSYWFEPQR